MIRNDHITDDSLKVHLESSIIIKQDVHDFIKKSKKSGSVIMHKIYLKLVLKTNTR